MATESRFCLALAWDPKDFFMTDGIIYISKSVSFKIRSAPIANQYSFVP